MHEILQKGKGKAEHLYSALHEQTTLKRSGMDHTAFNLQRTPCLPFLESLFTLDCNNKGTRGHLAKLSKPGCQKDVRKYFFHIV